MDPNEEFQDEEKAEDVYKLHKNGSTFTHGSGLWLYPTIEPGEEEEEPYLDLVSSVAHVGHSNQRVIKAIKEAVQSEFPVIQPHPAIIKTFSISEEQQDDQQQQQPATSATATSPLMNKKRVSSFLKAMTRLSNIEVMLEYLSVSNIMYSTVRLNFRSRIQTT